MVERPYKCPSCHASFKSESGMMCHLYRQHEGPQALEAMAKNFDEKLAQERSEKAALREENDKQKHLLIDVAMKFVKAVDDWVEIYRNITHQAGNSK